MSLESRNLEEPKGPEEGAVEARPASRSFAGTVWKTAIGAALIVLIAAGVVTSAYDLPAGHRGVVLRFGRFQCVTGPGLHFKTPFGIDRVIDVDTDRVETETFGFRPVSSGIGKKITKDPESMKESLVLTGDLNMINIGWSIEYKRQDPGKFLFNTHDPVQLVRDVGESVLRQVAGDRSLDHMLQNREEVTRTYQGELQAALDRYDCGIKIVSIRLQDIGLPDAVSQASDEVNEARQEKERLVNEAMEAYGREIPKARGEALGMVDAARGYAAERVNRARGEASRFNDVLREYRKAREVTKKRLYLETCREIIPKARNVIVIDSKQKNIPPLDLDKLDSSKGGRK